LEFIFSHLIQAPIGIEDPRIYIIFVRNENSKKFGRKLGILLLDHLIHITYLR